jgi:APA family basic amino acid/polyamine antiporter
LRDKLFPAILPSLNSKGVPYVGMIISGIIISLFMSMNYTKALVEQFRFLLLLSVFTMLVPYLFSVTSYILIRLEKKSLQSSGWVSAIILGMLAFSLHPLGNCRCRAKFCFLRIYIADGRCTFLCVGNL